MATLNPVLKALFEKFQDLCEALAENDTMKGVTYYRDNALKLVFLVDLFKEMIGDLTVEEKGALKNAIEQSASTLEISRYIKFYDSLGRVNELIAEL
ncbi:hypothetical protein HQ571_04305 [Candidatus Kuenenbacteria bacterium]|nr:hypothetical protein [Candidatus Kuenenbacteria bacterium]